MYLIGSIGFLSKALKGRETLPTMMSNDAKDEDMEKAHSTIFLCLGKEMFCLVAKKDMAIKLWLKLEGLYVTNLFQI